MAARAVAPGVVAAVAGAVVLVVEVAFPAVARVVALLAVLAEAMAVVLPAGVWIAANSVLLAVLK